MTLVATALVLASQTPPAAAQPEPFAPGRYLGTAYDGDKPSTRPIDEFHIVAPSVRLTLDKDTYILHGVNTRYIQNPGGPVLICSGTTAVKDGLLHLTRDKLGPGQNISIGGWEFIQNLVLKQEADGSLSLVGKPPARYSQLAPQGLSLRFVPMKKRTP